MKSYFQFLIEGDYNRDYLNHHDYLNHRKFSINIDGNIIDNEFVHKYVGDVDYFDRSYSHYDIPNVPIYFRQFKKEWEQYKKKSKIILYRMINAKSESKININKIGVHTTNRRDVVFDTDVIDLIGVNYYDDTDGDIFLITMEASISDIDIYDTIHNRLYAPQEYEYTLYKNAKPKIIKIENVTEEFR